MHHLPPSSSYVHPSVCHFISFIFVSSLWDCFYLDGRFLFKSLRGTLTGSESVLPPSVNETIGEQTGGYFLSVKMSLSGPFSQQDHKKRFVVYEHDRSAVRFFSLCGWKQEDFFLQIISVVCANKWCFSHSWARQDLLDRKQYHFCPHEALQSTQNERSSGGFDYWASEVLAAMFWTELTSLFFPFLLFCVRS